MSANEPVPLKAAEKIWLFCADTNDLKEKFMKTIIKLRLKKQHDVGLYLTKLNIANGRDKKAETLESYSSRVNKPNNDVKNNTQTDGYWVLLQDWSTCSKKCGSGIQFQQLTCVPPNGNGKPCQGPSERTRPCNTQPCPDFQNREADKFLNPYNSSEGNINKPIIKQMPISTRPLRYDKCHIKEADVIISDADTTILPNKPTKDKQPARLIMNDKSISAYSDDSISKEIETLILSQTVFSIPSGKTSCFILSNKTRRIEICNLGNSNSIAHMNFVDEWKNDFDLFKNQCNNKDFTVQLDPNQEKDIQNELNSKIEQAKLEAISEKNKLIKVKSQLESPNSIDKIQEMGMLAVRKEMKFGELLINEENLKEKQEIDELTKKIQSEKAQEEMLMKSIIWYCSKSLFLESLNKYTFFNRHKLIVNYCNTKICFNTLTSVI